MIIKMVLTEMNNIKMESTLWIDLPHRRVIAIVGEDAFSFVRNIFSNHPKTPSISRELSFGALLKAQGQVISDVIFATLDERTILCEIDAHQSNEILTLLNMYKLKAKVAITLTDLIPHVTWHPASIDLKLLDNEWHDPRGPLFIKTDDEGIIIKRLYEPIAKSRNNPSHSKLWRELRHENGLVEYGDSPIKKPVYALDINLDLWGGVDFHKGCFIGQELTSRMMRRGHIKNRLVGLSFASPPIRIETKTLTQASGEVGEIYEETDDNIWIANLRIDRYEADQALFLGSKFATVSGIGLNKINKGFNLV
jgi:tRNA-modifying protein YgfZ